MPSGWPASARSFSSSKGAGGMATFATGPLELPYFWTSTMPNSPVSKTRPAAAIPPARPLGQTLRPGLMGLLSLVILLLLWQGIAPRYPNVISAAASRCRPGPGPIVWERGRSGLRWEQRPCTPWGDFAWPCGGGRWAGAAGRGATPTAGGVNPHLRRPIGDAPHRLAGAGHGVVWSGPYQLNFYRCGDRGGNLVGDVGPMVFTGAVDAMATLNPQWLEVAQVYQLRGRNRFRCLYWPHLMSRLLPVWVAGLGLSWRWPLCRRY